MKNLFETLVAVDSAEEAEAFLRDLLTPQELEEFQGRWIVANLLYQGDLSYRAIAAKTGMSVTTIGRVSRFLKKEPYKGYKKLIEKHATQHTHHGH